jgi:hypothetical protein
MFDLGDGGQVVAVSQRVAGVFECGQESSDSSRL